MCVGIMRPADELRTSLVPIKGDLDLGLRTGLEEIGKKTKLVKYLPHMFVYCNFMMTLAALRALYQEIFKEVFWEKTAHPGRGVRWQVTGT